MSPNDVIPATYFWLLVDHWQTLIAGILAVAAAVITVVGTISVTMRAAGIQAKASMDAAHLEVRAVTEQNQMLKDAEARREAEAMLNFLHALDSVIGIVEEDVKAAREIFPKASEANSYSPLAYTARKRIKTTGFQQMLETSMRNNTEQSAIFISICNMIEEFSSQTLDETGIQGGSPVRK